VRNVYAKRWRGPLQRATKRRVGELAVWNVKSAYRETNVTVQAVLDWCIDVWCSSQIWKWKTWRRRTPQESFLRVWCVWTKQEVTKSDSLIKCGSEVGFPTYRYLRYRPFVSFHGVRTPVYRMVTSLCGWREIGLERELWRKTFFFQFNLLLTPVKLRDRKFLSRIF